MSERLADHLSLIPIFSALQPEELQTIEKYMFFNKMEPGEYVFKEGEKGDYVCFVASGALDVIKFNQNAQPVVITTLAKGGSIGEMALIDKLTRSASVRACGFIVCAASTPLTEARSGSRFSSSRYLVSCSTASMPAWRLISTAT